jgi:hypothetical protein
MQIWAVTSFVQTPPMRTSLLVDQLVSSCRVGPQQLVLASLQRRERLLHSLQHTVCLEARQIGRLRIPSTARTAPVSIA